MDREPRNKDVVSISDLPRWELSPEAQGVNPGETLPEQPKGLKFPVNEKINSQITLWMGEMRVLDVDAVVNTTNESMTDSTGVSGSLLDAGGAELRDEISRTENVKTGEARLTKGYNIAARYIIHTVGPRYNDKYKTAAENALHSCYRSCLSQLKEQHLKTIAFPVINSQKRGYPPEGGAHIAIRTVRRFLENWGKDIELAVFVVNNTQDLKLYSRILPLYFPRNRSEEILAKEELPRDTGNEYGETVIEERKIRITAFPTVPTPSSPGSASTSTTASSTPSSSTPPSSSSSLSTPSSTTIAPSPTKYEKPAGLDHDHHPFHVSPERGEYESPLYEDTKLDKSFATMRGDLDEFRKRKLQRLAKEDQQKIQQQQIYQTYLYKAQQMDLSDVARLNVIYESGKDALGRPIVVIIGYRLPTIRQHLDRVFLYLISIMDKIAESPYCVVYLHTFMEEKNTPEFSWLKQIYEIMDSKYGTNLANFFVIHPTFWLKLFEGVVSTFMVNDNFWTKLRYMDKLEDVYAGISQDQLHIPEDVVTYDVQTNGRRLQLPTQASSTATSARALIDDL